MTDELSKDMVEGSFLSDCLILKKMCQMTTEQKNLNFPPMGGKSSKLSAQNSDLPHFSHRNISNIKSIK